VAAFIASLRLKIKDCSKTVQESYSSSHLCTTRESAINGKSWIMMHRCFNCKKSMPDIPAPGVTRHK